MFETISKRIEKFSISMTSRLLFFQKEKEYGRRGFDINKLNLFLRGFYSAHPVPFDYKANKYSDYISDLENIKMAYINHPYGRLLRNKLVFSNFFNSYFKTPECYCVINKGQIEPVNAKMYVDSVKTLIDLIEKQKIIFKPLLGTGGKGIILLETDNNAGILMNKKPVSREELKQFIRTLDSYLVTEFIQQSKFAQNFFPLSANTVRITTFYNNETSSAFIPHSFMRFGRKKSFPADNISQGGIFSVIDVKTGELSPAFEIVPNQRPNVLTHHPDTNVLIKGVIIPHWDELKDYFIKVGNLIKPFIKIVGWDIILTEDSFVVIEGNNGPNFLNCQGYAYPLAKNPDVYNFLKYHGIR